MDTSKYADEARLGPLLSEVCKGARWRQQRYQEIDQFPSDETWAGVFENLLEWFTKRFPNEYHSRVLSRLRDDPNKRDQAFAEIMAAHVVEVRCGYQVVAWEPSTGGDFTFLVPSEATRLEVCAEVKAPGWQGELIGSAIQLVESAKLELEGAKQQGSPPKVSNSEKRLNEAQQSLTEAKKRAKEQPKYEVGRQGEAYDHHRLVRHVIEKAYYPAFPISQSTTNLINCCKALDRRGF